ncbi:MAG: ATP-binding protein [Gammaproteobacteria bacterium]|nr:ATP-binding protein [Gammaproteobacteria bacterium]
MSDLHKYLRRMADSTNREKPYAFVGREEELDFIRRGAALIPPEGGVGGTTLIMGPPGTGKTALMEKAVEKLQTANGYQTAVIRMGRLKDKNWDVERNFLQAVAAKLGGFPEPIQPEQFKTSSFDVNLGIPSFGGGRSQSVQQGTLLRLDHVNDLIGLLSKKGQDGEGFQPFNRVVVAVDEIQNLQPNSWAANLLEQLHTQSALPIYVLCAGLGNSLDALDRAEVSRPATNHILRPQRLTIDQSEKSVLVALDDALDQGVGRGFSQQENLATLIADVSDGWPAHLHTYTKVIFKQLFAMPEPSLALLDVDKVIAEGNRDRKEYYDIRIKSSKTPVPVIKALFDRISKHGGSMSMDAALNTIGKTGRAMAKNPAYRDKEKEWKEHFNNNIGKCYENLLRSGVISQELNEDTTIPIPTLTGYIEGRNRQLVQELGPLGEGMEK